MRDLKTPPSHTRCCRYFAGLYGAHSGVINACWLHIPYKNVETQDGEIPCNTPGLSTCPWLRYRAKNTWRAMIQELIVESEETERQNPNWKLMGLVGNYLKTPNGTCCATCGVMGAHYMVDSNPCLYWYAGRWTCEACIPEES